MKIQLFLLLISLLLFSCKKDNGGGGNNGGGGGSTTLQINSAPTGYIFWGDTMTISGTGFGNIAADISAKYIGTTGNYTTAAGNVHIVSATNTQLKITAPLGTTPGGNPIGPDNGRLVVTVKGVSDTSETIKFVGFPILGSMCYHYGGVSHAATTRPGDSTLIQVGVQGLNAIPSGYSDQLILRVNGTIINTIRRNIGACSGFAFQLSPVEFCEIGNCTVIPGTFGEPARKMNFTLSVNGTNKSVSVDYFVLNHPTPYILGITGSDQVSISAGGNPVIGVQGRHLYFSKLKWTTTGSSFETDISGNGVNTTQLQFSVPLSLVQPNKLYTVSGLNGCNMEKYICSISVLP